MPTTMKVPPSPSQRQPNNNPSQATNKGTNRISSGNRNLVGWNPSPTAKRRIRPAIANADSLASHSIRVMKQLDVVRDSFMTDPFLVEMGSKPRGRSTGSGPVAGIE